MLSLDDLARKYGTDKQCNIEGETKYHDYTPVYEKLLESKRLEYRNVMEIGVREGWSHKMWYDYFPNAIIYGFDNMSDPYIKDTDTQKLLRELQNDRIKINVGDQTDIAFLKNTYKDIDFDLIIDDGGHHSKFHQISFSVLFKRLKSGCYYIIEDMSTCNMRAFREFDDFRSSTLAWLESIIQGSFFSYYMGAEEVKDVESVEFIGELGIIKKK